MRNSAFCRTLTEFLCDTAELQEVEVGVEPY